MFASFIVASALISAMKMPDLNPSIVVFKPIRAGQKPMHLKGSNSHPFKLKSLPISLRFASKLDFSAIQSIVTNSGGQKPMSGNVGLHFDARNLVVGDSTMAIVRSSVDPVLNAIVFDISQGGGIELNFVTKPGNKQYFIDVSMSTLTDPKVSAELDGFFEQRSTGKQVRHLCWLFDSTVTKHNFKLWTTTPSFFVIQAIDITEMN